MSESANQAVFLSYASQDAEAARRICETLRAAGVEVWFDQSELVGGDAWDQKIRRQIRECALFIPILSQVTQGRREAYFRLEWKLADERTNLMAKGTPFLLPVTIDDTNDQGALVPDSFLAVQWTKLPDGKAPPAFAERVKTLLRGAGLEAGRPSPALSGRVVSARLKPVRPWLGWAVIGVVALAAIAIWQPWKKRGPSSAANPGGAVPPRAPWSEARQLAERGFAMSVDSYDSSPDDFKAAEGLIKQALELDPNDGEIWAISAQFNLTIVNRGFDYSPNRVAVGHEQAERAIRLVPDSAEARFALAFWQRSRQGNLDTAIETFRSVLAANPAHARALLFLGLALINQGKDDEGFAMYERARRQPKWAPLADYLEFIHFFAEGKFAEADRAIRRSIAAKPVVNSVSGLAMLQLTWKGDADEAARELDSAPEAMLGEHRIVWITAQVQFERRAPDEALKALDRLPDDFIHESWFIGPKNYLVGRAYALAGRPDAARVAWISGLTVVDAHLKDDPTDITLHLMRGELLAWLGRNDEALSEARTVEEMDDRKPDGWDRSTVKIYAAMGRADLALPILGAQLEMYAKGKSPGWPLTPALLRLDPLWDKLRADPGFLKLIGNN
jgi:tetratricopeptide (TPR) repeat protein